MSIWVTQLGKEPTEAKGGAEGKGIMKLVTDEVNPAYKPHPQSLLLKQKLWQQCLFFHFDYYMHYANVYINYSFASITFSFPFHTQVTY